MTRNKCAAAVAVITVMTGCGAETSKLDAVHRLMTEEMEPAAEGIWDAAGYVITAAGEESLYPTTDEGWRAVAGKANELAAAAEKLKDPLYAIDNGEWVAISESLVIASGVARAAADSRNEQDLFDAGGQIYGVCLSCHQAYSPELIGEPLP
ncbi:MAG: hypothetical protein GC152_15360 [Alphaproteobacteria bacterium]|nr:hypothetical protein [Alphaproteobacteria bacterium]